MGVKIVVDLPKSEYEYLAKLALKGDEQIGHYERVLIGGTPLPKGHGRLIDADEYKEHLYACETNGRPLHIMELDERLATVDDVPTVIEADKEGAE